jgi:hypothetical protein
VLIFLDVNFCFCIGFEVFDALVGSIVTIVLLAFMALGVVDERF